MPSAHMTRKSTRTGRRSAASGHLVRTKAMPPTNTSTDKNASIRSIPNAIPTARCPWLAPRSDDAALVFLLGAPTEKVKPPAIGCESAETTRHVTTYVPSLMLGTDAVTVELDSPCTGLPIATV